MTTGYSRNIVASLLVTSVLFLISCTPMWTFEFHLDEKFQGTRLNGWVIESDMFCVTNKIADLESIVNLNKYVVKLHFRLPKKDKRTTFFDLDVDSIKIIIQNYQDTVFLRHSNYFYSSKSDKEISKSIDFVPEDVLDPVKNKFYRIYVPEEIDSLILQFDVILREAEYFSYLKKSSNIERDSLRVIENREPIIVPIELRLHKYVSKM